VDITRRLTSRDLRQDEGWLALRAHWEKGGRKRSCRGLDRSIERRTKLTLLLISFSGLGVMRKGGELSAQKLHLMKTKRGFGELVEQGEVFEGCSSAGGGGGGSGVGRVGKGRVCLHMAIE